MKEKIKKILVESINPYIFYQRLFYKKIPIIINNFNQLTNLLLLIKNLKERGYTNIYIIDNASTYQPLLDFYASTNIKVFRLKENVGHLALWENYEIYRKFKNGYYVLTDPDIIFHEECPDSFLKTYLIYLRQYPAVSKVGCALRIDDIPDYNPLKEKIINWEQQFWQREVAPNVYYADIDTTFALYRPNFDYSKNFYAGIRIAGPYTATHAGWYQDPMNPTEEEFYYRKMANDSSSWTLDRDGKVRNTATKYFS